MVSEDKHDSQCLDFKPPIAQHDTDIVETRELNLLSDGLTKDLLLGPNAALHRHHPPVLL